MALQLIQCILISKNLQHGTRILSIMLALCSMLSGLTLRSKLCQNNQCGSLNMQVDTCVMATHSVQTGTNSSRNL